MNDYVNAAFDYNFVIINAEDMNVSQLKKQKILQDIIEMFDYSHGVLVGMRPLRYIEPEDKKEQLLVVFARMVEGEELEKEKQVEWAKVKTVCHRVKPNPFDLKKRYPEWYYLNTKSIKEFDRKSRRHFYISFWIRPSQDHQLQGNGHANIVPISLEQGNE